VTDSHGRGYGALFSPAYRKRTALAALPWFLMDIATYGIGLFTPVILGAIHFGRSSGGTIAAGTAGPLAIRSIWSSTTTQRPTSADRT